MEHVNIFVPKISVNHVKKCITMYDKACLNVERIPFSFWGKIWIKLNHLKTVDINCFECDYDLIGLEQA